MSIDITPVNNNSNAADNVATSTDNDKIIAFGYGFDGTSWDRLRLDANNNLNVNLNNSGITLNTSIIGTPNVNLSASGITLNTAVTGTPNFNLSASGITLNTRLAISGITLNVAVTGTANVNLSSSGITLNTVVTGTPNFNLSSSGITLNVAVTGTPKSAIYDYTGAASATVQTNAADGFTTSFNTLYTSNIPYIYNNSTFDRARSAYNDGIAATGIAASGLMGWAGAAFDRVKMGNTDTYNFGVLGAQPMLWNGSVYERARSGATDGSTLGIQSSAAYLFNGTSWDRPRSAAVGDVSSTFGYGLQAEVQYGFNGNGYDRIRSNNQIFYQEYILFTAGQSLAIWDPGAGKKFRLQSVMFGSSTASIITLRDGSSGASYNNVMTFNIPGRDTVSHQLGPNGYLSIIAGNKLWAFNAGNATTPIWFTFTGNFE